MVGKSESDASHSIIVPNVSVLPSASQCGRMNNEYSHTFTKVNYLEGGIAVALLGGVSTNAPWTNMDWCADGLVSG